MRKLKIINQVEYSIDTKQEVIQALELAYQKRIRITLDLGDTKTGRSWNETCDISGYVGRSTGVTKLPLLVHNSRSLGGGAILTDCILSIRYSNKNLGGYLYKLNKRTK